MDSYFSNPPIVMDTGSYVVRAGFSGEDMPKLQINTVVGRPKLNKVIPGGALNASTFVGKSVIDHRGALHLTYPVAHGRVDSWDDLELLWNFALGEDGLCASAANHTFLLTEAPHTNLKQRSRTAEIFFEGFQAPALSFNPSSILSLFATGRTTGTVLESGEGVSSVTPIYEGYVAPNTVQCEDIGGRVVNDYLGLLLRKNGVKLHTGSPVETLRSIKESVCYASPSPVLDEANSLLANKVAEYTLPDGQKIRLDSERFRASEVLFRPQLLSLEAAGVVDMLQNALSLSDLQLRRELVSNIVLAGGNTLLRGFAARVFNDLKNGTPDSEKIRIWAPTEREQLAWLGGSIMSSLSTFKGRVVTQEMWRESGERLFINKF